MWTFEHDWPRNDFERAYVDLRNVLDFPDTIPEDRYDPLDNFWRGYYRTDEPAPWSLIEPRGLDSFFDQLSGRARERGIWGVTRGDLDLDIEGLLNDGMDYLDSLPDGPSLEPVTPDQMRRGPSDPWQSPLRPRRVQRVMDVWAVYLPIHLYGRHWGIYLFEHGIWEFASWLWPMYKRRFPRDPGAALMIVEMCVEALLRHELEHHKFEAFALQAELLLERSVFLPAFRRVYRATYARAENLEEGLANNAVLRSAAIDHIVQRRCPAAARGKFLWREWMRQVFDCQAPAYANYELRHGLPMPMSLSLSPGRQSALRVLCNQILEGTPTPTRLRAFDAFSPDGYADRFERQAPLYVVPSTSPAPPILLPRRAISGAVYSSIRTGSLMPIKLP